MNSKNLKSIKKSIRAIAGSEGKMIYTGEVTRVDGETCSVTVGGISIDGVWLTAVHNNKRNSLIIEPKRGSIVMMVDTSGGDMRQLAVIGYTEVESITVNGGENGGLINIAELTQKLNALVNIFNTHTHSSTSGVTGTPSATVMQFNRGDYEDNTIKH